MAVDFNIHIQSGWKVSFRLLETLNRDLRSGNFLFRATVREKRGRLPLSGKKSACQPPCCFLRKKKTTTTTKTLHHTDSLQPVSTGELLCNYENLANTKWWHGLAFHSEEGTPSWVVFVKIHQPVFFCAGLLIKSSFLCSKFFLFFSLWEMEAPLNSLLYSSMYESLNFVSRAYALRAYFTHTSFRCQSPVTFTCAFHLGSVNCCSLIKAHLFRNFRRDFSSNGKAQYLGNIKTHMASTEEAVKNENSTAQSNNSSEASKPSQPAVTNPVGNTASSKAS